MTPHTFIGRCKRCKLTRRFVAPVVSERKLLVGRHPSFYEATERTRDITQAAPFLGRELQRRGVVVGHETTVVEPHDRQGAFWLRCPAGHQVEFKKMTGKKTDELCSAKCLSATGPNCECGCGGENHGKNHDS